MGLPLSGAWARKYQRTVPYVDARKWGTGINPIHAYRTDPGRPYTAKLDANDLGFRTRAENAVPQQIIGGPPDWGYEAEDIAGLDVFASPEEAIHGVTYHPGTGRPSWEGGIQAGQSTPVNRGEIPLFAQRPLGAGGGFRNFIRGIYAGARNDGFRQSSQIPVETVSEGWVNKASTGFGMGEVPDDEVLPSAIAQYERNTSMQQRHKTTDNSRAVGRCADEPRTSIPSRIAPMKLKIYSGEERHYDMFPYQIDAIPRPFTYRTAGTGPGTYLLSNDQHQRTPLQRTPPPDPSMGVPDTELSSEYQYGYENEDIGYY